MDKKRSAVDIRAVKIQSEQIREKLQKSIMDNPLAAKKAAFVIGLWLEGKTKVKKKAGWTFSKIPGWESSTAARSAGFEIRL